MPDIEFRRRPIIIPASPHAAQRRRKEERDHRAPRLLTFLIAILVIIAVAHLLIVAHDGTSPGLMPATNCNGLIRTTDFTQSVDLQAATEQMEAVEFVSQLDGGQPAALAQVAHNDAKHTLDVYIFGCSIYGKNPQLTTLFAQRGLLQGTVEVSNANTLITGAFDTSIAADAEAFLLPLQQNIYREYAWQDGDFKQVAFPGLYPVASRTEAEALQQDADSGQILIWNDPLATAEEMSRDIFKWSTVDAHNIVLSNDGTTARVELFQSNPHMVVDVTLKRLLQHDSRGLWFVVAAHSNGITLGLAGQNKTTAPQDISTQMMLSAPIQLNGTSVLVDGTTSATLFDHTMTPISSATHTPLHVNADGTYSGSLNYSGIPLDQQGLLLIQSIPQPPNNKVESGQLLLIPVLLG